MTSLLQLRQVTHFYGNVCALRDVNLEIEPGAIGLIGQNGAGKSTMMQILLGLIRPTQGTAPVLGHDVRTAGIRLRGRVGFMPERDSILPGLNGIEVTRQLHATQPRTAVVALSMHVDERFVGEMLRAGAVGYLCKKSDAEEVLAAIRARLEAE